MTHHVFLCYSRGDDISLMTSQQISTLLRRPLEDLGHRYFIDESGLEPGDELASRVLSEIASADIAILLITPSFFASEFVQNVELPAIRRRQQDGALTIVPVLVNHCLWRSYGWLRDVLFANNTDQPLVDLLADRPALSRELFSIAQSVLERCEAESVPARVLPEEIVQAGVLSGPAFWRDPPPTDVGGAIPPHPRVYWRRAAEISQLLGMLGATQSIHRSNDHGPGALTQIVGDGGSGKSLLASEVCQDAIRLGLFQDGVYWLRLTQSTDLVEPMRVLADMLGGDSSFTTASQGFRELRGRLASRNVLVVLDNVSSLDQLSALHVVDTDGATLVTARRAMAVHGSRVVRLDPLDEADCVRFLEALQQETSLSDALKVDVSKVSGGSPLAIAIWSTILSSTNDPQRALQAVRRDEFGDHPFANVFSATAAAVSLLDDADVRRYLLLAIFAPDGPIPSDVVHRWWSRNDFSDDPQDSREALQRFANLQILSVSEDHDLVEIRDLACAYMQFMVQEPIALLHNEFLNSQLPESERSNDLCTIPLSNSYAWKYLTYHLRGSGRTTSRLVIQTNFVTKSIGLNGISDVLRDLAIAAKEPDSLSRDALRLWRDLARLGDLLYKVAGVQEAAQLLSLWRTQFDSELDPSVLSALGGHSYLSPVVRLPAPSSVQLMSLVGHQAWVLCIAWSESGDRVASADSLGQIIIWDGTSGACLHKLSALGTAVRDIVFTRHHVVIAGLADGRLVRWNPAEVNPPLISQTHSAPIRTLALAQSGQYVVSGGEDGTVIESSVDTLAQTAVVCRYEEGVSALAVDPSSGYIGVGLESGIAHVVARDNTITHTEVGAVDSEVTAVHLGHDHLLIAGRDGELTRVPLAGSSVVTPMHCSDGLLSAAVASDGKIAAAFESGDIETFDPLLSLSTGRTRAHGGWARRVALQAGTPKAATAGDDGIVRIWDLSSLPASDNLLAQVTRHISFSDDDRFIVTSADNGAVRVLSANGLIQTATVSTTGVALAAAVSGEASRIAAVNSEGSVHLWALGGGPPIVVREREHSGWARLCVFMQEGRYLLTAGDDGLVNLYRGADLHVIGSVRLEGVRIRAFTKSPDQRSFAVGGSDGTIAHLHIESGGLALVRSHQVGVSSVRSLAFDPSGQETLAGMADGSLLAIDWKRLVGGPLREEGGSRVRAAAAAQDGSEVVVRADGTISVSRPPGIVVQKARLAHRIYSAGISSDVHQIAYSCWSGVGLLKLEEAGPSSNPDTTMQE